MRVALVLAALLGTAPAAPAEDPAAEIREVISQQIEAMRVDDFATAFTFASPEIQRMFGSPARFGQMVRQGYPMVRRPRDVRFLDAVTRDGGTVQGVLITDDAGVLHVLDYEMVPLVDGWRIGGVRIREAEGGGA
jgi:uncharacterized protein DUF4864